MMELWDIGCECRVWYHTGPVDVPSLRAGAADGSADEEFAELEEREELERVPARSVPDLPDHTQTLDASSMRSRPRWRPGIGGRCAGQAECATRKPETAFSA